MSLAGVPFLTFEEMRLARRMAISDVAAYLGVSEEVVTDYEMNSGNIPCGQAVMLCELYRIPSIEYIRLSELTLD